MFKNLVRLCLIVTTVVIPLQAEIKVLAFSGSTRTESLNKKLIEEAAGIARSMGASVTVIDLRDYPMPFYDADLEKQGMPEYARKFRDLMISHDAVIIASPNYNRSISGVLKNALDWASRGENGRESLEAFEGKTFAIMSTSSGKKGGCKGLAHLREILSAVHATVVPTQVSVPYALRYFSEQDHVVNALLKQEITELLSPTL
jgi:NAD(P)H-dependent FMN reductase